MFTNSNLSARWGTRIGYTEDSFMAACTIVEEYFMPMAKKAFGDATLPTVDRNAATLAKWILQNKPVEVHVRTLLRDVRLPRMNTAEAIHAAARALVDASWLKEPESGSNKGRAKAAYPVNPRIFMLRDGSPQ